MEEEKHAMRRAEGGGEGGPQDDGRMRKRDEGKTPDGGGMRRGEEEGGTSEGGKGSMRRSSHWEKGSMGGECEKVCIIIIDGARRMRGSTGLLATRGRGCSDGKKRRERGTKQRSDMERNNMKGRMEACEKGRYR